MLSRTADNLFWMCRYTERAENTARMLDVNLQMSLLPQDAQTREGSWLGVLRISELQGLYQQKYASISPHDVLEYMVRDPENPSSIFSCMRAARENARAVRGSLTTEVWETYNTTWLELLKHLHTGLLERNPGEFFEWVKFRSHLARGVTIGTMLQDEALYFLRIGMHLERADNTARMLDVKFHERGGRGAAKRVLPLVGAAQFGVGAGDLPQGVPRRHHPGPRGRTADPARRHAALAAGLDADRKSHV